MSYGLHEYAVEARATRMYILILKNEFRKSGCTFFRDDYLSSSSNYIVTSILGKKILVWQMTFGRFPGTSENTSCLRCKYHHIEKF